MAKLTFSGVLIDHPGALDRSRGATSKVSIGLIDARNRLQEVPLTEDELVKLIAQASHKLAILRGVRL